MYYVCMCVCGCVCVFMHIYMNNTYVNPGGGGGALSYRGGPHLSYVFRGRWVFFEDLRMSAILEKKGTFLYPDTKYGGQNPLTIQETYAALTPRDSRSIWASEFAAPICCR